MPKLSALLGKPVTPDDETEDADDGRDGRNDAPLTGEAPQPAKPQPLRRVGSFTLGVCLIAAGIFFLLAYFVPGVTGS